ncbi:ArsR/SmtB family transcription factor [Halorientalis halophila]|uniref:ArsR/SmtB family transcription factor n=1 Tax=Halorientalis halophila TaxID=3108499 RepID=UPI00300B449B
MSLLPSEPDTAAADEAEPRVIGVDSEDADDVLSALTSETARTVLSELHDDPAPPAALADRVDTSLQNVQYHLEKLEDAGAIEVIDQIYSEKGREMNVYAPADRPLVIMAGGDEEQQSSLRTALSRFLGSLGIVALASLAVQAAFGTGGPLGPPGGEGSGDPDTGAAPAAGNESGTESTPTAESRDATPTDDGGGMEIAEADPSQTPTEAADETTVEAVTEAARTTADAATDAAADGAADAVLSLPPGLLFFLGGMTALLVVGGVWYLTD